MNGCYPSIAPLALWNHQVLLDDVNFIYVAEDALTIFFYSCSEVLGSSLTITQLPLFSLHVIIIHNLWCLLHTPLPHQWYLNHYLGPTGLQKSYQIGSVQASPTMCLHLLQMKISCHLLMVTVCIYLHVQNLQINFASLYWKKKTKKEEKILNTNCLWLSDVTSLFIYIISLVTLLYSKIQKQKQTNNKCQWQLSD